MMDEDGHTSKEIWVESLFENALPFSKLDSRSTRNE